MTTVNGSVANSGYYGGWRVIPTYSVQDGATQTVVTVTRVSVATVRTSGVYIFGLWSYGGRDGTQTMKVGSNTVTTTPTWPSTPGNSAYWTTSYTYTYQKAKSASTKTISVSATLNDWSIADSASDASREKRIQNSTSSASIAVTVPALESYTVALDSNGGTGAPATLTKWYGESLALPQPSKEGYAFSHWTDGTTNYTTSYTANAAASLTAVYSPIITSATITQLYAARDDGRFLWDSQTGKHTSASDDGEYVYIRAWWRVDGAATATVSLGATMADTSTVWTGATRQAAKPGTGELYLEGVAEWGTTQTALATGQYDVTVTLSTGTGNPSDTRGTTVPTAFFTIDVLAGGHGIAFGKPATQAGLMDIGFDVETDGDITVGGGLTLGAIDYIECGLTANTAAGTTATWTYVDVKLDTENVKYGTALSLATSGTNRYGVVVSKDGYYRISGYANVNAPSYVGVVVGGDVVSNVIFIQSGYNGAGLGSSVRYLSAGSVIKLRIERTGSTDPTVAGTTLTKLTVERVG